MNSERKRKLVFGGLVVVLSAWVGLTYLPPQDSQAAEDADQSTAAAEADRLVAIAEELAAAKTPDVQGAGQAAVKVKEWAPNPFGYTTPAAEESSPPIADLAGNAYSQWALTAIMHGEAPRALINGEVVRVEDVLPGGAVVVQIEEFSVTIRDRGQVRVLSLPQ